MLDRRRGYSEASSRGMREGGEVADPPVEAKPEEEKKDDPPADPNKRPEPDQEKDFTDCLCCQY